ncbi:aliphatic sulfonate ABC transporter substrate-binding protein [Mesorhizobium sp. CN2-181]|uniref:aliphatic sulfonate ABC transporter substrate-binding protein n=1 Tax=Mesorhizobium yinganensis TaxID=3157707 RepID=UPI0032B77BFD
MLNRRFLLSGFLGAALLAPGLSLLPTKAAGAPKEFRIGYQKSSSLLVAARQQKVFETRLKALGVEEVKWVEFQFGPPLLEALGAGAVDFGVTGDTPPILAQSAGAQLVYAASSPAVQNAILVPNGSPIQSVTDLKGKKVAFGKGCSSHNFTVQALKQAGLAYSDIVPAFLAPADAVAAFTTGSVDAWAVWDPYFAIAEAKHNARPLVTTADGLDSNSFYLASKAFSQAHPDVLKAAVEELSGVARWAAEHKDELASISSEATGIDLAAQKAAIDRYRIEVGPLSDAVVAQQQAIADTFLELKLIPNKINVREIVWAAPIN